LPRLILLTQKEFVETVAHPLRAAGAAVEPAYTVAELDAVLAPAGPETRLISFGAGVIVPEALLKRLSGPAYNFHPGPPAYPGIYPSVFALYDGAATFGVTVHEMAPAVDSGPIVALDSFPIPAAWDRLALDTAAFSIMMRQLHRLAPRLADTGQPIPRMAEAWTGRCRTRKDFEALCRLPDDATNAEFTRRYRAVGEGPEHALSITRFGRTFRLDSDRRGDIVRAGLPITHPEPPS
jgi:methionyl-tRNA formyltransferase